MSVRPGHTSGGNEHIDLDQFVSDEAPQEGGDSFQFENAKRLDVSLDGNVVAKAGSMVAYTGDVSFERKTRAASRGC